MRSLRKPQRTRKNPDASYRGRRADTPADAELTDAKLIFISRASFQNDDCVHYSAAARPCQVKNPPGRQVFAAYQKVRKAAGFSKPAALRSNQVFYLNQISMMTGRIIGLRLVFLNRYWLRSFLMVDLMVAQSEILRAWQTSSECAATIFIASIRSSLSFM